MPANPLAPTGAAPSLYRRFGKRALDLGLALALLPAILPALALLWLAVRLDGGPGFFAHPRVGRGGRPFRCWKLRSMRPDADLVLARLLARDPAARAEWAASFRLARDPRVTPLGRMIRRLHLDELPQIWNVLRGEMSLVGPRPVTYAELRFYYDRPEAYLDVRPGVTGLWQVEARHLGGFAVRTARDARYLDQMGIGLDLALMLRTATRILGVASGTASDGAEAAGDALSA